MNKHMHRLVFDRRRGMRVAAAETARSAGKAARPQCYSQPIRLKRQNSSAQIPAIPASTMK